LEPHLHSSSGHVELFCEPFAELGIRLGIALENIFQDLELSTGSPFPMLDFIRNVRIEGSKVDRRGIDAGRQ
jgi:hypothetical protein